MQKRKRAFVVSALAWALAVALNAEIVDSSALGFSVKSVVTVAATPQAAYRAAVRHIGRWWHPQHTFSGDAANLRLQARAGGMFLEKLPGGGSVRHMTVVYAAPGELLRLSGGLGPLQALAVCGSLTLRFAKAAGGSTVEMEYAVGGYAAHGLQGFAAPVDGVLAEQLARLKAFIGTPTR